MGTGNAIRIPEELVGDEITWDFYEHETETDMMSKLQEDFKAAIKDTELAKKETPLKIAMRELHDQVQRGDSLVTKLEESLSGVLKPETPQPTKNVQSNNAEMSPIVELLLEHTGRLRRQMDRIECILQRCEI